MRVATQSMSRAKQAQLWHLLGAVTALGQGGRTVRRQGRDLNPRPRAVPCAPYIGGEDDLPNQRLQLDNWHCKPKHLRVIYANNLTVKGRQDASTVMLHGDLYLLRERLR